MGLSQEPSHVPHFEGVLALGESDFDLRVALIWLQVCGGGRDGPVQVASKAVLLHGARAKLREAVRHTARHWLRFVEDRVGAGVEDLSQETNNFNVLSSKQNCFESTNTSLVGLEA